MGLIMWFVLLKWLTMKSLDFRGSRDVYHREHLEFLSIANSIWGVARSLENSLWLLRCCMG